LQLLASRTQQTHVQHVPQLHQSMQATE